MDLLRIICIIFKKQSEFDSCNIRNVLKRPQGRDVPLVSRLGVRGDIRSYTKRDSLGYRSVLGHGQKLMGQLANEGFGKNKIGRLATRTLGLRCGPLETSKVYKNSFDSLPVDCTMNELSQMIWSL